MDLLFTSYLYTIKSAFKCAADILNMSPLLKNVKELAKILKSTK